MPPLRRLLALLALAASPLGAQPAPRDPLQEGLPLRPDRTLSFTTKTGQWMSLDVSPDGRTLVFDLLGDLYTMPIAGGKATPLTRGMAFDGQPRFSPDGKKVLFVSDRDGGWNLWTMSLDKRDTAQLTRGIRLTRTRKMIHCTSTFRSRPSKIGRANPSHPAMTPEAPAAG